MIEESNLRLRPGVADSGVAVTRRKEKAHYPLDFESCSDHADHDVDALSQYRYCCKFCRTSHAEPSKPGVELAGVLEPNDQLRSAK